jgi:hypothetical protein
MMEQEVDIQEVLKELREVIGVMAQENAILKATITKINERSASELVAQYEATITSLRAEVAQLMEVSDIVNQDVRQGETK